MRDRGGERGGERVGGRAERLHRVRELGEAGEAVGAAALDDGAEVELADDDAEQLVERLGRRRRRELGGGERDEERGARVQLLRLRRRRSALNAHEDRRVGEEVAEERLGARAAERADERARERAELRAVEVGEVGAHVGDDRGADGAAEQLQPRERLRRDEELVRGHLAVVEQQEQPLHQPAEQRAVALVEQRERPQDAGEPRRVRLARARELLAELHEEAVGAADGRLGAQLVPLVLRQRRREHRQRVQRDAARARAEDLVVLLDHAQRLRRARRLAQHLLGLLLARGLLRHGPGSA